jgi:hypothetical protein
MRIHKRQLKNAKYLIMGILKDMDTCLGVIPILGCCVKEHSVTSGQSFLLLIAGKKLQPMINFVKCRFNSGQNIKNDQI